MAIVINGSTGISATESSNLLGSGVVEAADLASGAAASNLGTGNVTAAMLASTLDLSGKTVTLPAGTGGKILQVVQGTTTTEVSISGTGSNTTVLDTTLSASITPSSTSSKILVLVQQSKIVRTGTNPYGNLSLLRDSTGISDLGNILYSGASGDLRIPTANFSVLDSPNTTSSVTYKTTFSLGFSASGTIYVQQGSNTSFIQLLEISA